MNKNTTKYRKPDTEVMPLMTGLIICVSGDIEGTEDEDLPV